MPGTVAKIAAILLGVVLLGGAAVSMAVYGSVDPCEMLAEERARKARDAAEDALGDDAGPEGLEEAAERARELVGRAAGDLERAAAEAGATVEGAGTTECARELWSTWF